jgi:hypothetical protein
MCLPQALTLMVEATLTATRRFADLSKQIIMQGDSNEENSSNCMFELIPRGSAS